MNQQTMEDVMRLRLVAGALLAGFALVGAASPAFSSPPYYEEDFTTTTWRDASATTAWWDTDSGRLRPGRYQPSILGQEPVSGIEDVLVRGHHIFLARGLAGVTILDVAPAWVFSWAVDQVTPGPAHAVDVDGRFVYVAAGSAGLLVWDWSNWGTLSLWGYVSTPGPAVDVDVQGDMAWVAMGTAGVAWVDVSDPGAPVVRATFDTPDSACAVVATRSTGGANVYVADGTGGVRRLVATDPWSLSWGSEWTALPAWDVAHDRDGIWVATGDSGVVRLDDVLAETARIRDYPAWRVHSDGTWVIASGSRGAWLVDAHAPGGPWPPPTPMGPPWAAPGRSAVTCGVLAGWFAVVADGGGVRVVQVADPVDSPVEIDTDDTGRSAKLVVADGRKAIVGVPGSGGSSDLYLVELNDPSNIAVHGPTSVPSSYLDDMVLRGQRLWVAAGLYGGIRCYDIIYQQILWAYTVQPPYSPSCLDVRGSRMAVGETNTQRLVMMDAGLSGTPSWLGSAPTTYPPSRMCLAGDVAIVGTAKYNSYAPDNGGVELFDVSNPANPVRVGTWWPGGSSPGAPVVDLAVEWPFVYVLTDAYLYLVNARDPSKPFTLTSVLSTGEGMTTSGRRLYVANGALKSYDTNAATSFLAYLGASSSIYDLRDAARTGAEVLGVGDSFTSPSLHVLPVASRAVLIDTVNTGQSITFVSTKANVEAVALRAQVVDSVTWSISADDGATWAGVAADGAWHAPANPGTALRWRGELVDDAATPDEPSCSWLRIDWLTIGPQIESIVDVPNDEGHVRLRFRRSSRDTVSAPYPTSDYVVYRREETFPQAATTAASVNAAMSANAARSAKAATGAKAAASTKAATSVSMFPPGTWVPVDTVNATGAPYYTVDVPTHGDSTTAGYAYSAYVVVARIPWLFGPGTVSDPDSAYSRDDVAPEPPANVRVAYCPDYNTCPDGGNRVTWSPSPSPDVVEYKVVRLVGFLWAGDVGVTSDTTIVDPGFDAWPFYRYGVATVDDAGNYSATIVPLVGTGVETPASPPGWRLGEPVPNPFNPATTLTVEVPAPGGRASVVVYDAAGRRVRTIALRRFAPGRHAIEWDGRDDHGHAVASGVYFVRLKAPGVESVQRAVLLK